MTTTKKYETLHGLFFWCKIAPKVRQEPGGEEEISRQFRQLAKELDCLGVSWRVQNAIAAAAIEPKNKDRYFSDIYKEIITN